MAAIAGPILMQQLSSLRSQKLHSSTEVLGGLMMTIIKNNSDAFTPASQYEILTCYAEAKFKAKQFRIAETTYRRALGIRKSSVRQKNASAEFAKLTSEIDVKYKIYLCCQSLGNDQNATSILESIPAKYRPAKIHHALAKIYHKTGMNRSAIASYKEVLKKAPLALDVIFDLLLLGESLNDIIPLLSNTTQGSEWILNLIKAHALMHNKEFSKSFSLFETVSKKTAITNDPNLHCSLGLLRARTGNNKSAILHFENARMADSFHLNGMDIYSYLLHEENEQEKLEKFACHVFSITEQHPATWVALGYRSLAKGDYKRAVYLSVQATKIDPLCVQAIVLKGCALRAIDEVKDAIAHFREALRIDPHRFVCYKELVETYLPRGRVNEAVAIAHTALQTIGLQANCLVLCASVHVLDGRGKDKALNYVNKALSLEPNNRHAIIVKAGILFKHEEYSEAIKFLSSCIENYSSSPMHLLLGNCYQEVKNYPKAVDHYTIALSLNPDNKEAADGLSKISNQQQDLSYSEGDTVDTGQYGNDAEVNSDSDVMYTE